MMIWGSKRGKGRTFLLQILRGELKSQFNGSLPFIRENKSRGKGKKGGERLFKGNSKKGKSNAAL